MICGTRAQLAARAREHPPGFTAAVLAVAREQEGQLCVDGAAAREIGKKFPGIIFRRGPTRPGRGDVTAARPSAPPISHPPPEPTVREFAANFGTAIARWLEAGAPVVDQSTYHARAAACAACEFWDAAARAGLGKCRAPGCGCTKLKRWLATERCPFGKWPVLPSVPSVP